MLEANDKAVIIYALNMWANYIETDNVVLSAEDAKSMGKPVKVLDSDQIKFVKRLKELGSSIISGSTILKRNESL